MFQTTNLLEMVWFLAHFFSCAKDVQSWILNHAVLFPGDGQKCHQISPHSAWKFNTQLIGKGEIDRTPWLNLPRFVLSNFGSQFLISLYQPHFRVTPSGSKQTRSPLRKAGRGVALGWNRNWGTRRMGTN
jgi:hypothetical protein